MLFEQYLRALSGPARLAAEKEIEEAVLGMVNAMNSEEGDLRRDLREFKLLREASRLSSLFSFCSRLNRPGAGYDSEEDVPL